MYKTPPLRATLRSCDVEKVRAVVARSTFQSQKCKKLMGSEHFLKLKSTFRSQKCKKLTGSEHFLTFRCPFAWQAQGILLVAKSEKKRKGSVAF